MEAVRRGYDVRLPWGVEHLAHANWAKEDQIFQSPQVVWVGILGTTGRFHATWYNRATGEVIRNLPQRVSISWSVDYPQDAPAGPATPLFRG